MNTLTATKPHNEVETKDNTNISINITQKRAQEIKSLLVGYPLEMAETGKMDILEALIFQTRVLADIEKAQQEYENGDFYSSEEVFSKYNL